MYVCMEWYTANSIDTFNIGYIRPVYWKSILLFENWNRIVIRLQSVVELYTPKQREVRDRGRKEVISLD